MALGFAGCLSDDENGDDDHGHSHDDGHDDHGHGDDDHHDDDHGGESDAPGSDGLLYAFAPDEIAIIDPETGTVVETITDAVSGASWGDPRITHDHSEIYVINDALAQVLVIDTETRSVVTEVDIGPGATHMYHPKPDEIWAHADDEGAFYVIDTDSHDVVEIVDSGLEGEGHGKLLYHEDFGSKGYATNVNDPGAPIIDMDAYERNGFVELGEEGGTHYKAYAPQSGLAYFERSGGVGETGVVDVETDRVVDRLEFAGGMYLTPDETMMGVLDGDSIRFFDATSEDSDPIGTVEVDGGPDALRYYDDGETLYAFTANTMNDEGAVIDVDALDVVDTLTVGDIERPEGARFLHRSGVAGGGYFFTPAEADGTVAIVDMAAREVTAQVPVADGVDTLQYVGDSGTGHTGT
ncbi:hypothetical protein GCM10025298_04580 [Natronobiforma cellulositropha]